ncbi:MAG: hypothetical protein RQ847_07435 [Wenzhouxiangellaceae bacterium]|nr:hypothetical protein [Wenzhouxiangellaceae bacterium]
MTLFLLWLYWYSAPPGRTSGVRIVDSCLLALAPAAVVAIIVIGHARIDDAGEWTGMGLNVMLVAAAYLALIALLGLGWLQRMCVGRGPDSED